MKRNARGSHAVARNGKEIIGRAPNPFARLVFSMKWLRNKFRKAGAASKTDSVLVVVRLIALGYQIAFGAYLPVSKYLAHTTPVQTRYLILFAVSLLISNTIQYIPKTGSKKWEAVATARLKCTNIAVSKLIAITREGWMEPNQLTDIANGLLVAVRQEVESVVQDSEGIHISANLLTEDGDRLTVRGRANPDRAYCSYPKEGMVSWEAMVHKRRVYRAKFDQHGKDYHCLLILPLLTVDAENRETCIGVVTVDSDRTNDFDGVDVSIETRLLPYLSLLKLALTMEHTYAVRR